MENDVHWIQVGELAEGISENLLADSRDLIGKSIRLFFEDGSIFKYTFISLNQLSWTAMEGHQPTEAADETYRSTCIRDGVYFVDFVKHQVQTRSVSLVLDLNQNAAIGVFGNLPLEQEARRDLFQRVDQGMDLSGVKAVLLEGSIGKPFGEGVRKYPPTSDLIGKRVKYVYSRTETYEHIYLNEHRYTWHCLEGIEKGLADTDECYCRRIEEKLFLFVWREKIVPTLGVVLIDMHQMKTTGKIFGYASSDFGKVTNVPVGAYASLINEI